ncbi:hypothetical protein Ae201684_010244 [Aphanomyces euteiches]|uniref:Uncharacterized protein n=1 Tax=Aphanomyces euteiches TaxID=100861 RepID=A0A6G0WYW9_9STRA|nr:hypothetical protein Ae201684_010244 [Aphanomyces euteiches]
MTSSASLLSYQPFKSSMQENNSPRNFPKLWIKRAVTPSKFAMRHPSMRTSQRPNLPLKSRDHGQPTLLFRLKTSVDHLSYHPTYLARLILLHLID